MPVKHFGVITETRVVDGSVEQVFDFLADFSTTQQWDPGVVKASRDQAPAPLAVGDTFQLTTVFNGKESEMKYELREMVRPNRIVVVGNGDIARGTDIILLRPADASNTQTVVDYSADLSLKGWRRPFIAFLSSSLDKLGKDAMAGITKACHELFAAPS